MSLDEMVNRLLAWLRGGGGVNTNGNAGSSVPVDSGDNSGGSTMPPPPPPPAPIPVEPDPVPPAPTDTGSTSAPISPDSTVVPPSHISANGLLNFGEMWANHPTIKSGEMLPCRREDGVPNFGNQCAIRLGVCLHRSHLLNNYDGVTCWFGHEGHTLRARELATWMRNNASTFGPVEIRSNVEWSDYVGKVGLIYCQNFWGENNQGDHIDLWDGTGDYMGQGNFSWEGPAMASGGLDYIERSEEVWFWRIG